MNFNIFGCNIIVTPLFTAAVTALLLCDKTGIMPIIMLAVLIHECGHIFAMAATKNLPQKVEFLPFAIEITPRGTYKSVFSHVFVSAAGVAVNTVCTVMFYVVYCLTGNLWAVALSSANLAVLIFNLLPVNNLDGGDVLNIFCIDLFGEYAAQKINAILSAMFLIILIIIGIYFFIKNKNPTLLIFCLYIGILQPILKFSIKQKKFFRLRL